MDYTGFLKAELAETLGVITALEADTALQAQVIKVAELCIACLKNGGQVLWAGNGGSAADAQHLAAELTGRMNYDRPGLNSQALMTNTSAVTAIGNDYGYDVVVARQLAAVAKRGDVFIGISTSGNSKNIVAAMDAAREKGVTTVGFTGADGGEMRDKSDVCLRMPSNRTPKIQECHIAVGHIICGMVEEALFAEFNPKRKAAA